MFQWPEQLKGECQTLISGVMGAVESVLVKVVLMGEEEVCRDWIRRRTREQKATIR